MKVMTHAQFLMSKHFIKTIFWQWWIKQLHQLINALRHYLIIQNTLDFDIILKMCNYLKMKYY